MPSVSGTKRRAGDHEAEEDNPKKQKMDNESPNSPHSMTVDSKIDESTPQDQDMQSPPQEESEDIDHSN